MDISTLIFTLIITAIVNGIIKSPVTAPRKTVVIAFAFLSGYAMLVYFNEDSMRIFGGWLFERAEELSILADYFPRLFVLAGMPVLAVVMLYIILVLLDEPKNLFFHFIKKMEKVGVTTISVIASVSVFFIGLDAIARGSLDFAVMLLRSITLHNCVMAICLSGMMTGFMYLLFETYVAIASLPELIKLLRYKPKHRKR